MKNPRPFLLPPFPKAPCKVAVLGHPLTGKSELVKQLSDKFEVC